MGVNMSNKIRAKIIRGQLQDSVIQKIELYMIDIDDVDDEHYIGTIFIDEIEIAEDFIKELYQGTL